MLSLGWLKGFLGFRAQSPKLVSRVFGGISGHLAFWDWGGGGLELSLGPWV